MKTDTLTTKPKTPAGPVGTAEAKAMLQSDWLRLHKENKRLSEQLDKPMGYATALQRAIEYACKGKRIPESIAQKCPHHAALLNNLSSRALTEFEKLHAESLEELIKRLK